MKPSDTKSQGTDKAVHQLPELTQKEMSAVHGGVGVNRPRRGRRAK